MFTTVCMSVCIHVPKIALLDQFIAQLFCSGPVVICLMKNNKNVHILTQSDCCKNPLTRQKNGQDDLLEYLNGKGRYKQLPSSLCFVDCNDVNCCRRRRHG